MTVPVRSGTDVRRWSFGARGLICLPASDDFPDGIEDEDEARRRLSPPRSEAGDWTVRTFRDQAANLDWRGELTIAGPTGRHMRGAAWGFDIYRRGRLYLTAAEQVVGCCFSGDWLIFVTRVAAGADPETDPELNKVWRAPKADLAAVTLLETIERESATDTPWVFSPDGSAGHCIEWQSGAQSWLHTATISGATPGVSHSRVALPGVGTATGTAYSEGSNPLWTAVGHYPRIVSRSYSGVETITTINQTPCGDTPTRHVTEIVVTPFESAFTVSINDRLNGNGFDLDQRFVLIEDSLREDMTQTCPSNIQLGTRDEQLEYQLFAVPPWGVEEKTIDYASAKGVSADGVSTSSYTLTYSLAASYRLYCMLTWADSLDAGLYNAIIAQIEESAGYSSVGALGNKSVPITRTATYLLRKDGAEIEIGTRDLSYTASINFATADVCNQGCGTNSTSGSTGNYNGPQMIRDSSSSGEADVLNRLLEAFYADELRGPLEIEWREDATSHSYSRNQSGAGGQLVARDYHTDGSARDIRASYDVAVDGGGQYSVVYDYRMYIDGATRYKNELLDRYSAASQARGSIRLFDHADRTLLNADYERITGRQRYQRDRTFNYSTGFWSVNSESTVDDDVLTVTEGTPYAALLLLDPRAALSLHGVGNGTDPATIEAKIEGLTVALGAFGETLPLLDECLVPADEGHIFQPGNTLEYTPATEGAAGLLRGGVWYYLLSVGVGNEPDTVPITALVDSTGIAHDPVAITGITGDNPTFDPVGVV